MAARQHHTGVESPWVLSDAEIAAAAEIAAEQAERFAAEWAALTPVERAEAYGRDWPDPRDLTTAPLDGGGDPTGDGTIDERDQQFARLESGWLSEAGAGRAGSGPHDWLQIAAAEPGSLGEPGDAVLALQATDRLIAWAYSRAHLLVDSLCTASGSHPAGRARDSWLDEQHVIEEIQLARRASEYATRRAIETAAELRDTFATFRLALADGDISDGHVRALINTTRNITDDPAATDGAIEPAMAGTRVAKLTEIARRTLPRAKVETVGEFYRTLQAAVCAVDAVGEAERRAAAKQARYVSQRSIDDGLGQLVGVHDDATMTAVYAELDRRARDLQLARGGAIAARKDPDAALPACRADALVAAVLGGTGPTGLEPVDPAFEGHLVIDLPTLTGAADNPCTINGVPVPAPIGRELASGISAWRRIVTDPLTGHLLDYGRRVYLPAALMSFIRARDGHCTAPYCQRPARRCQVDHHDPFPEGPSNPANCSLFCDRHHPAKTHGIVTVTDSRSDGTLTWSTPWGQHVRTRARPYLDNPGSSPAGPPDRHAPPDPGPPDAADPPDDEPPF